MMTISDVTARVAAGQVTSEKLTEECLSKIAELNPKLNAFITVTGDAALAQARARRQGDRGGPPHRSAARHSDFAEGPDRSEGRAHLRGIAGAQGSRGDRGRGRDAPAARSRRGVRRQDQPARVRVRHDQRGFGIRPGPQSARSVALAGRLERRFRGGGRVRNVARHGRHRHRRIDSHPGGGVRHRRAERPNGDTSRRPAWCRSAASSITSARSPRPSRMRGCSTTRCSRTADQIGDTLEPASLKGLRIGKLSGYFFDRLDADVERTRARHDRTPPATRRHGHRGDGAARQRHGGDLPASRLRRRR